MRSAPLPDLNRTKQQRLPASRRRALLLEAAVRAFSRNGFNGTKTKDIAAEAGVTEALLFRHFPTKDDLYAAILETVGGGDWVNYLRPRLLPVEGDPRAWLIEFALSTFGWYRERPEMMHLVMYSALEQHSLATIFRDRQVRPVYHLLVDFVARNQQAGRFMADVKPESAAHVIFSVVAHQGLVTLILRGAESRFTDEETAQTLAHIVLRGLRA